MSFPTSESDRLAAEFAHLRLLATGRDFADPSAATISLTPGQQDAIVERVAALERRPITEEQVSQWVADSAKELSSKWLEASLSDALRLTIAAVTARATEILCVAEASRPCRGSREHK